MKNKISRDKILILGLAVFFAVGAFFLGANLSRIKKNPTKEISAKPVSAAPSGPVKIDAKDFPEPNSNFDQLKSYFHDLAQKKGARYAFEILRQAPLGPNIDLHLLGHTVGDELYKQEGLNGITDCNNDFRNACSHSIVIGLFYDKGEG